MSAGRLPARVYFGLQALAGGLWWIFVFVSSDVRRSTMGDWNATVLAGPDLVLFVGASAATAATANRRMALVTAVWTVGVTIALTAFGLVTREAGWGVVAMLLAALGTVAATGALWLGRAPSGWFFVGPFAFHVAADADTRNHLRRSLCQLVVFWTTFFIAVPIALIAVERRLRITWPALRTAGLRPVAVTAFTLASLLGLWACISMAVHGQGTPLPARTARHLVIHGPYRYVRNPMAIAGALQTASVGLWAGSWTVIAMAAAGAIAWDIIIRPVEEEDLAARLGDPYKHYRAHVRRWVPTLRRLPTDLSQ